MLVTLIYVSESVSEASSNKFFGEIEEIRHFSSEINKKLAISGFLFYFDKKFIQLIEGEFDHVTSLFSSIKRDIRHRNIRLCWLAECQNRAFEEWSMDASMAFTAMCYEELAIKLRFLNRFVADTTTQPIILKDLLISVAGELQKRLDFPRPALGETRPMLRIA